MQFLDGYIIEPHIVSGSIKLSVFSALFAVIFFGGIWGFWGLLVGTPVFAVIYDIGKKVAYAILRKKGKEHIIEKYESQREHTEKKKRFSFRKFFKMLFKIQDHPEDAEHGDEDTVSSFEEVVTDDEDGVEAETDDFAEEPVTVNTESPSDEND